MSGRRLEDTEGKEDKVAATQKQRKPREEYKFGDREGDKVVESYNLSPAPPISPHLD
jgi:hypothetical protein